MLHHRDVSVDDATTIRLHATAVAYKPLHWSGINLNTITTDCNGLIKRFIAFIQEIH